MRCPYCGHEDTQVKDSRPTDDASAIRRRRICTECGGRFTTFERVQLRDLTVVKKSGRKVPFDREKLARSVYTALRKRSVEPDRIERMISGVVRQLESLGEVEVTSEQIGEYVMDGLKGLDDVAFVRFASVYKNFSAADDFKAFLAELADGGRIVGRQGLSLSATDRGWLDAAVALAEPMLGTTAENPTVGAIVVGPDGSVLGRGVTAPGGRPHAEPQALSMAGAAARAASLYVTLEPCNHWGRTPPCVDALIDAGIGRIVIGIADPDPRTAGQGIARLRAAGIEVDVADHAVSARLHEGFVSRVTLGRPFVTAKLAVSPDGRIGRRDQGNVRITGEDARRWTHRQRSRSDAVMVGAGTARLDNPRLNVRLPGLEQRKPLRLVVAGRHALDANLTLFASANDQPVAVIGSSATDVPPAIRRIDVPEHHGRPDLDAALQALGALGISTLLVEGGGALNDALLDAGLIDRFCLLDGIVRVGADGVRASAHGSLEARLAQAGLTLVDQQRLGVDKLRTFEKA